MKAEKKSFDFDHRSFLEIGFLNGKVNEKIPSGVAAPRSPSCEPDIFRRCFQQACFERMISVNRDRKPNDAACLSVNMVAAMHPKEFPSVNNFQHFISADLHGWRDAHSQATLHWRDLILSLYQKQKGRTLCAPDLHRRPSVKECRLLI